MTTTKTQATKPKRRWFRFSLRTLLVLMTVLGAVFGWLGVRVNRARKQREAVAWVQQLGGTVYYDYEIDDDGYRLQDAEPPGPEWLRGYVRIDFLDDVRAVDLDGTQVSNVAPLAGLTSLKELHLCDTQVKDVTLLAGLTSLELLKLSGTQVSDVIPLTGLSNLKGLYLGGTQVSEVAVEQLQKALPKCDIKTNRWEP